MKKNTGKSQRNSLIVWRSLRKAWLKYKGNTYAKSVVKLLPQKKLKSSLREMCSTMRICFMKILHAWKENYKTFYRALKENKRNTEEDIEKFKADFEGNLR